MMQVLSALRVFGLSAVIAIAGLSPASVSAAVMQAVYSGKIFRAYISTRDTDLITGDMTKTYVDQDKFIGTDVTYTFFYDTETGSRYTYAKPYVAEDRLVDASGNFTISGSSFTWNYGEFDKSLKDVYSYSTIEPNAVYGEFYNFRYGTSRTYFDDGYEETSANVDAIVTVDGKTPEDLTFPAAIDSPFSISAIGYGSASISSNTFLFDDEGNPFRNQFSEFHQQAKFDSLTVTILNTPPSPVPLPAGAVLLATALGGLGLMRRRPPMA